MIQWPGHAGTHGETSIFYATESAAGFMRLKYLGWLSLFR